MKLLEAYEWRLKEAIGKHETLLGRLTRASDAKKGDYQNQIEELREDILFLEEEIKKVKASQATASTTIYCYVFTNTLTEVQNQYQEQERLEWLKKRYNHSPEDWQPFVVKYDPITIKDILSAYQQKYPLEVIYWESKPKHYSNLDKNFAQTFAVLDWLALKPSNRRGFFRYDSHLAKYIAPNCATTYELFSKKIEENKEEFDPITTTSLQTLKGINMDLFNSSDLQQMKEAIRYFLDELSGNIVNQSEEESSIRGMNFNWNAK